MTVTLSDLTSHSIQTIVILVYLPEITFAEKLSTMSSSANKGKRKLKSDPETEGTKAKKQRITTETREFEPQWSDHELLAEQQNLSLDVSRNIVQLLDEGNTIPFIARYRQNATRNMTAEALREAAKAYEEIAVLKTKIQTVMKQLDKTKVLNEELKNSVTCIRSMEELEYIYAPFKPGSKRTLAEKAKEMGLEEAALNILQNSKQIDLNRLIKSHENLPDLQAVQTGIIHIIAGVISTDTEMLSFMRKVRSETNFALKTKKSTAKKTAKSQEGDETKFENYANFEIALKYIKPHQILAINRGESLKVLSVKITVPDSVLHQFTRFCTNKWINVGAFSESRVKIIKEAITDSYNRLVQPLLIREIRAELRTRAERASCDVFSTNLKHLLLAPPLKGKAILGMDPGYSNGCKLALVSPLGVLLAHDVIYPHKNHEKDVQILRNLLLNHECDIIALGNGTACRKTEEWLSRLLKNGTFQPLDVKYTIVNEDGASIYSCSPEATKEFPNLEPNIISAVSLARRLQNPLAELVKVEPKHIGVGMYQHDLKKKQLDDALNEVVSECVSFVGVDLNTASSCLLRHIAGLSEKRASQIIQHRDQKGPFTNRKQILDVTGIGQRIFQQCAGFLRVGPVNPADFSAFYRKSSTTKLDCTEIHPESYDLTKKIVKKLNLNLCNVGDSSFINSVKQNMSKTDFVNKLCEEFKSDASTNKLILEALSKPLNYDLRCECPKEPLFKKGLTSFNDIGVGTILTGRVTNVTHFGCFVDIGVGSNGLIHSSKYNGLDLQIGVKVEVEIINIEPERKRIGLRALRKI